MKKYISSTDLAKALNLSPSTVSRALNDHYAISDTTKKRVMNLAKKLGYFKNMHASSLIHQKTFTIGIIVPEITSYFFSTVIRGIKDVLGPEGYELIIMQSNENYVNEKHNIEYLTAIRVDGILFSPTLQTPNYDHLYPILKNNIPFVNFDRGCDNVKCFKVLSDDEYGAFYATQHLIDIGCKRIAHIAGPTNVLNAVNRVKGYIKALRTNKLEVKEDYIIEADFSIESSKQAIHSLLDRKDQPDGIFAINDAVALGCISVMKNRGIDIPGDIAIVGFDDETYSSHFSPSLTTISNPVYEMGKISAQLCLKQINEEEPLVPEKKVLRPKLVFRDSSKKGNVIHYA